MTEHDLACLAAAREKRERRLKKFTDTPAARAQRLKTESLPGTPMTFPEPWNPEEQTTTEP